MRHVFEILVLAVVLLAIAPLIGFHADTADQFAAAIAHFAGHSSFLMAALSERRPQRPAPAGGMPDGKQR